MEDFILSTQILTEFNFVEPKKYKVRAIVFLVDSKKSNKLYEQELLGTKMQDLVANAVNSVETTFVMLSEKEDCFEKARQNIKDEDYTICLFSDTPLIKENTILEILDYAQTKGLDFCKMPRGFIVKSKNFVAGNIVLSADVNFVDKQEFFCVFDENTLCQAKSILRKRVLEKHLKNGVRLEDLNTIYIDNNVQIGKDVRVYQNCCLCGNTVIKDGATIKANSIITDSVIGDKSCIISSYIVNSIIKENSIIGPFEKLVNKKEKK